VLACALCAACAALVDAAVPLSRTFGERCKQPARCSVSLLAAKACDADAYLARRLSDGVDDHFATAHMHEKCSHFCPVHAE
jgi:hypothetical protein